MKKLKDIALIFVGFIGGIVWFLKLIVKSPEMLSGFKRGIIDDFERLLLGYNTIKTSPYSRKHIKPYYYREKTYSDYYNKSFEEDEEE